MADRVKGITVVLGGDTTGLSKALSGVNKDIGNTQKQLKDVERLLKLDPTNTQLLEQKQRLLGDAIGETKEKLDALKEAEKQVQSQFQRGEVSRQQYDALEREIADTEIALRNLQKRADDADNAVSGIDEKPLRDVEKAAKNADDALEDAGKEASSFGDILKAEVVVEGAKGLLGYIKDLSEETQEYKKIMGSLDISSEAAGYTADQTRESYELLYGVLGDEQTAATTLANLQAIGLSQADLTKFINNSIGAWAKYGDSIPIDGLAESINETIKAGQVTGTFADVLNWGAKEGETFGVKLKANTKANEEWNKAVSEAKTAEDFFNLALQDAGTEADRANLIMQAMADQGLAKASDAWQKNNESLIENNHANAELQDQLADLSELAIPLITQITQGISGLLGWFNSLDGDTQTLILTIVGLVAAIGPLTTAISGVSTAISFLVANPIVLLIGAIVALVALIATKGEEIQAALQQVDDFLQNIFVTDWTQIFGPGLGDALNAFFANVENVWNSIKRVFDGVIDFIRGIFTGDWERAWQGVQNIFGGIFDGLEAMAKAPLNGIIGLLNIAIEGINSLINGFNSIGIDLPDWLGGYSWHPSIPNIPKIPYLAKGGVLSSGMAVVGEAGPELLTMMGNKAVVQPLTNQTTNNANFGGITVNVYPTGDFGRSEADRVAEEIEDAVARRRAVFA